MSQKIMCFLNTALNTHGTYMEHLIFKPKEMDLKKNEMMTIT